MTEQVLFKKKDTDLFSKEGLTKQTGTPFSEWDIYVLKELIDNALDVSESAGAETLKIDVTINGGGISVRDNGPGLTRETVNKIVDLNIYAGNKHYYKRASRGKQGNALMTILPMPYVLSDGKITECAVIRSGTKQFQISIEHNEVEQDYRFRVDESDIPEADPGTEVTIRVCFGDPNQEVGGGRRKNAYAKLINAFSVFNPHCEFTKDYFGEKITNNKKGRIRKMKSESESIHWYSYTAFRDLVYAFIRAGHGSTTIKNFCISRFRGIGNSTSNEDILRDTTSKKLEDLRENEADIMQLHANLRNKCRELSPTVLGELGKKQLQFFFIFKNAEGILYKKIEGNLKQEDYLIPFVLEGIAAQDTTGSNPTRLYMGLNNSPLYDDSTLAKMLGEGDLRIDVRDGIEVALHLICPNVSFTDYSKKEFDLSPFTPAIRKILKSILADYYASRNIAEKERDREYKREEKDRKETEKKEKQKKKEKKQTLIEVFDATINQIYLLVTDIGKFLAYIRQAFYKHRPLFLERGLDINYSYYENTLVPAWEMRVGKRMFLRETRGVLLLPGREDYINIDTKTVYSFDPPKWAIKNVFYIEKRGFADALRTADIHNRYDIAILSGQGFTTDDIKLIMYKISVE